MSEGRLQRELSEDPERAGVGTGSAAPRVVERAEKRVEVVRAEPREGATVPDPSGRDERRRGPPDPGRVLARRASEPARHVSLGTGGRDSREQGIEDGRKTHGERGARA